MLRTTEELALKDYFFAEVIMGDNKCREGFLKFVCGLFKVNDYEELYKKARFADSISSLTAYYRYLRIKQFKELSGGCPEETDEERIADIKGEVLEYAKQNDITAGYGCVVSSIVNNAKSFANLVPVLRVTTLIGLQGCYFCCGKREAAETFKKLAMWNDISSAVYLLAYEEDKAEKEKCQNIIYTLNKNTICEEISFFMRSSDKTAVPECKILEEAFLRGKLKRDVIVPEYIDILYSEALSLNDKEKLLLMESPDLLPRLKNLPLKLNSQARAHYLAPIDTGLLNRPEELQAIARNLKVISKTVEGSYRPLCLYSESGYVLETYMKGIAECLLGTTAEVINAAELNPSDVYGNVSNIFVRKCRNEGVTLFLIDMRGCTDEDVCGEILKFTAYCNRKNFRLNDLGIDIDLSTAIPMVFCGSEAELRLFENDCDVVTLKKLGNIEKSDAIRYIMFEEQRKYGVKIAPLGRDAYGRIITLPLKEIEKFVDRAIRETALYGEVKITDSLIQEYCSYTQRENLDKIGFGGEQ